ncbi:MAG: hypothetical protein WKF31_10850 [Thermoleophilaceae bacterium]
MLSVGIGVTGLVTYAYFSLASYGLSAADYGGITLLWTSVFFVVSVLYRPVEQLLSRTIADRDAHGRTGSSHLRVAATIQIGFGVLFLMAVLLLREPVQEGLFGGSSALYGVLVVAVLAYAASYFARGFLAGHRHFALYGGSCSWRPSRAACSRSRSCSGCSPDRPSWPWGWPRPRSCPCSSSRSRSAGGSGASGRGASRPRRGSGTAVRSRAPVPWRTSRRSSPPLPPSRAPLRRPPRPSSRWPAAAGSRPRCSSSWSRSRPS